MKIMYIRANLHDATSAIPRAMEASENLFEDAVILCWDRIGIDALPKSEVQEKCCTPTNPTLQAPRDAGIEKQFPSNKQVELPPTDSLGLPPPERSEIVFTIERSAAIAAGFEIQSDPPEGRAIR